MALYLWHASSSVLVKTTTQTGRVLPDELGEHNVVLVTGIVVQNDSDLVATLSSYGQARRTCAGEVARYPH